MNMKKANKIIAVILSLALMLGMAATANAADMEHNVEDLFYTVYNENGDVVEEGITSRIQNTRYHWSPNITLSNGWYANFRMPGPAAFYVTAHTSMKFSYSLNRSAAIEYQFMKSSERSTAYANVWEKGTRVAARGWCHNSNSRFHSLLLCRHNKCLF